MNIILQRGNSDFLIEQKDNYYLLQLRSKRYFKMESPDIILRGGYCEEPHPTEEQLEQLKELASAIKFC